MARGEQILRQWNILQTLQTRGEGIIYGFPGSELAEEAERGEVELGGCVVSDADSQGCCQKCDHRWR